MDAARPNLLDYDIIEISSSGGKDSQAMLAHVSAQLRQLGILDRGIVMHADLGRSEWPGTMDVARAQAEGAGLPFLVRARSQGDIPEHAEEMGYWPKPDTRWCTSDHKRQQILALISELARKVARARKASGAERRPVRVLNCMGLRAAESSSRAKLKPLQTGARGSSGAKQVDVWLPIHGWTDEQVWAAVRASGWPVHPAYAHGFPRASCVFCIYAPRSALVRAGALHPDLLAEYVRVEQVIGHSFKRDLSMAEIKAAVEAGEGLDGEVESWVM